jgi:hypothetical protein
MSLGFAATQGIPPRSFHRKRLVWYYSAIIDWMMANPGGKLEDCANYVGKKPTTLSAIIRSDMFQAALDKRRRESALVQDMILKEKLTRVAAASLDTVLAVLETKKTAIPLETLTEVSDSALKRLGYGVETPQSAVQVNVNQTNQTVSLPVSQAELLEARNLMRQHQQQIASHPTPPPEATVLSPAHAASPIEAEILPPEKGAALVNGKDEVGAPFIP